jgi:CelD/BcsL family acetyltransferase involved in cellulose biosynthesis
MSYTVTEENLVNLQAYLAGPGHDLYWPSVFVLPIWLQTWQQLFGEDSEVCLRVVREGNTVAGIAPLIKDGNTVRFLGSTDVCDYMDFITIPGKENEFFHALMEDLKSKGVNRMDLAHVRPDSAVMTYLKEAAQGAGFTVEAVQEEISMETGLPSDWDEYISSLKGKQRHEIKRKLRRLDEAGDIELRFLENNTDVSGAMDTFFKMFTGSRQDKAAFLTEQMESFFRLLADNMCTAGLLRLGILELDKKPIAAILCFDYNDCIYLYNSGYDPEYNNLSAGLLSKVLAIQDSIKRGKKVFDFLKGAETYKYHLGGREVPLYRCLINIE